MNEQAKEGGENAAPRPARRKRPLLRRTGPIRDWTGVFGADDPPDPGPGLGEPRNVADPTQHETPPAAPHPTPAPTSDDDGESVRGGVSSGYRVIQGHLREGRRAAARVLPLGRRMSDAVRNRNTESPLDALFDISTEFVTIWMNLLNATPGLGLPLGTPPAPGTVRVGGFSAGTEEGRYTAGGGGRGRREEAVAPAAPAAPQPADAAAAAAATGPRVVVRVRSLLPVEVIADLRPGADAHELLVHDLRSVQDLPRIADVRIAAEDDGLRLHLAVPASQPPGTYSGVVVDADTSMPWGTVTATVLPDE